MLRIRCELRLNYFSYGLLTLDQLYAVVILVRLVSDNR
uniref:Uncharacterized protein n=1 Tax=Arundo donax TaxID=35708 RepID=A0A0A8XN47_ARUDO